LNFFAREFPKLEREWTVTLEERLERSTKQNLERIEPRFEVTSSGVQWFDLAVSFSSAGGERFSAAEIQRLVLSGQSHVRLKNGRTAVIDTGAVEELQEVLLDCAPDQHAQGYRINSAQAGFVESTLRRQPGWQIQAPSAWRDRAAKQSGETKMTCPPLGSLESVLRPYQKEGVAWLHFLRENGFGGILADEMGLGKTLQTLAYLATVNREPDRPTLVVCPTSLVFNWLAESAKFTPHLKTLRLHGPDRHALFEKIAESDLVVTSYALVRRDAEKYRGIEFDTVVLDEAQHIKNRQTQNAQAVKAIRSKHRLVLTGTPMENSVLDLWSIFDFLMPGYLGAAADFKERYEIPITRERNVESQARLGRRLRPFILRRMKRDVAKDLPEKLEQVAYCELTDEQRTVYQQIMEMSRKEVMDAVGAQGVAKSRMVVLNALLRLRQICCDLRLLKLEEKGKPVTDEASGKLEMFGELLDEALDGGHRVLVFSQFVSMLALLKDRLTRDGVEFCYLDGSTSNRAEVVSRFQTTATIPVFLISLKAGGVGLNLTGADTVIHFDPWWNPAVEDQATDRAHRIGQTRVVTSYKLIARDTVEEKILTLQNRKREIIKGTLEGEESLTEALSWEEIQELFS
ncbi:MAG: DEAD/DEAH box helicase, partial [Akkermansiaceae bacterium]|nr:DEAD/DEAH box helicase [Verrucomicrobiales bacterium]